MNKKARKKLKEKMVIMRKKLYENSIPKAGYRKIQSSKTESGFNFIYINPYRQLKKATKESLLKLSKNITAKKIYNKADFKKYKARLKKEKEMKRIIKEKSKPVISEVPVSIKGNT